MRILSIIAILLLPGMAWGACQGGSPTWTVASPYDSTEVQDCLDGASAGDTIKVPACTATWNTTVTISKRVLLMGAGIGKSIVTLGDNPGIELDNDLASWTRISGFTFVNTSSPALSVTSAVTNFRFDHLRLNRTSGNAIAILPNSKAMPMIGLIDNVRIYEGLIITDGYNSSDGFLNYQTWADPTYLGGVSFLILEDSYQQRATTSEAHAIDGNHGSKYVIRYSAVSGQYLEAHGIEHTTSHRGTRAWEFYRNNLNGGLRPQAQIVLLRAGTGMIWQNTVNNFSNSYYKFNNYRSINSIGTAGPCSGGKDVDGNNDAIYSGTVTANSNDVLTDDDGGPVFPSSGLTRVMVSLKNIDGGAAPSNTVAEFSTAVAAAADRLVGYVVHNLTDGGSTCFSTDSTTTTVTCDGLNGGTDNLFEPNDEIEISSGYCWNTTTGVSGPITDNTTTTVNCTPREGGWTIGDTYEISIGHLCRDQPGSGKDASLWTVRNTVPVQEAEPFYLWGNTYGGVDDNDVNIASTQVGDHVVENTDYFTQVYDFDGSSGVSYNTLAYRPANCTTGTGFWATDQGSWNSGITGAYVGVQGVLYKCTSPNNWELYYTPLDYPHPFRTNDGADGDAPTVTIASLTGDGSPATVTFTAHDGYNHYGGVDECKYRIGSNPDISNGVNIGDFGFGWGSHTVDATMSEGQRLYIGCYDAAGNWGYDSMQLGYGRGLDGKAGSIPMQSGGASIPLISGN